MSTTDRYYYGTDGSEPKGPLPLAVIHRMVAAGDLSPHGLGLAPKPDGPWQLYQVLTAAQKPAQSRPENTPQKAPKKTAPEPANPTGTGRCRTEFSIGPALHSIGLFLAAFALVGFVSFFLQIFDPADPSRPSVIARLGITLPAALGVFVSGALLMACGELLAVLYRILAALRK